MTDPTSATAGRILLVDDDALFLRSCELTLSRAGLSVETANSADAALRLVNANRYDTIVSDLRMPGSDGLAVLRAARQHDPTVPFVLMTGAPDMTSAITAVNMGATRYLAKPFELEQLVGAVRAGVRQRASSLDLSQLNERLTRALAGLWMAYQPIVAWQLRAPYAYEALLRTGAAGIAGPGEMLALAEKTNRLFELGRAVRANVARAIPSLEEPVSVFVNLHPADLEDEELYSPDAPLSQVAHRVVLELTERASVTHDETLDRHIAALHELGYRIAVDDLGAGYAGLTTLARVQPEFVKLDGELVREVERSKTSRAIITAVMTMAEQLNMLVIAECVETPSELAVLRELGIEYLQGYLFAKPSHPFCEIDLAPFRPTRSEDSSPGVVSVH